MRYLAKKKTFQVKSHRQLFHILLELVKSTTYPLVKVNHSRKFQNTNHGQSLKIRETKGKGRKRTWKGGRCLSISKYLKSQDWNVLPLRLIQRITGLLPTWKYICVSMNYFSFRTFWFFLYFMLPRGNHDGLSCTLHGFLLLCFQLRTAVPEFCSK